jgi:hypothetical protein
MPKVVITDVTDCPSLDAVNGPFKDWIDMGFVVTVADVNAFDMGHIIAEHDPDLILSFGTWRNVLPDASKDDRMRIQRQQCRAFGNDANDFLCALTFAVLAQSKASFLMVGPNSHIWRLITTAQRPCQRFKVIENYDYYQTSTKKCDYTAWYWPADPEKVATVSIEEKVSVKDILRLHQKILVISAGRGEFWRQVMDSDELGDEWLKSTNSVAGNRDWANRFFVQNNETYAAIRKTCDRCEKQNKHVCWRCYNKWKKIAEVPNKKFVLYTKDVCVATDHAETRHVGVATDHAEQEYSCFAGVKKLYSFCFGD